MSVLTVGSHAAKYWGINRGEPKDRDIWITQSELEKYTEASNIDLHVIPNEIMSVVPHESGKATKDALYTIKCSHFQWDIHWEKTKADILYMKSKGCKLLPDLYETLKNFWKKEHGNKEFLSLKQSKDKFFNDFVDYKYDHDYLHELVALPSVPVYTHCLKDNEDVLIDKEKFFSLPFDQQVKMFKEEITVIACERWLLSDKFKGDWLKAYHLSLKKTLTNLTKGWASDFIIFNLEYFINPDFEMFRNLFNNLEELKMSKVDMKVFEEVQQELGYDDINEMVYHMCEDSIEFGNYEWKNEWPDFSLKKENPKEYQKLQNARFNERNNEFTTYCDTLINSIGYEHLEQEGGGEGGSEYCYGVFKLKGKIYKASYSYYSYNGHEYSDICDTLQEVTPVEKTVIVYE